MVKSVNAWKSIKQKYCKPNLKQLKISNWNEVEIKYNINIRWKTLKTYKTLHLLKMKKKNCSTKISKTEIEIKLNRNIKNNLKKHITFQN